MRTRACLATLLLAAAGFAVTAPPALAQDNKDAVTDMARRRFQEGVKFFDQKRYEEARAAFLQAYALKHHPAVLLNLAQSEIRSGHPLEAARHFSAYLRESPGASGPERSEAEKGLAAARTKLGRIHVVVPTGAEVVVDGESVGQAPFSEAIDVMPGTHTVEGKLGTRTASSQVSVQVGKSASVTLNLEGGGAAAPPPPVAPATGAPPVPPPAPTEPQEKPPEGPKEGTPPAGETVQVSTEGREPFFIWLGHNGVGIAGVAATLIGGAVGTGFAIAANKASDNADTVAAQIKGEASKLMVKSESMCTDPRGKVYTESILKEGTMGVTNAQRDEEVGRIQNACNMLSNNLDVRKKDRTYATAGFVLAGVGLTATLAAYFLTSGKSSSSSSGGHSSLRIVTLPVVGPGQAGLTVLGTF
jgi:hypothetical protein